MPKLAEGNALAIVRIATGLLVFVHGLVKVQQGPLVAIGKSVAEHGFPASFAYVVTVGELCGLLLALGLHARVAAGVVTLTMGGVSLFVQLGHLPDIGGGRGVLLEYPALLALLAGLFVLLPSTRWSLDRKRGR